MTCVEFNLIRVISAGIITAAISTAYCSFAYLLHGSFVVNSSEDGWWEAETADGKQGVVPKTLLKVNTRNFLVGLCYDAVNVSINFELKKFGECKW